MKFTPVGEGEETLKAQRKKGRIGNRQIYIRHLTGEPQKEGACDCKKKEIGYEKETTGKREDVKKRALPEALQVSTGEK